MYSRNLELYIFSYGRAHTVMRLPGHHYAQEIDLVLLGLKSEAKQHDVLFSALRPCLPTLPSRLTRPPPPLATHPFCLFFLASSPAAPEPPAAERRFSLLGFLLFLRLPGFLSSAAILSWRATEVC